MSNTKIKVHLIILDGLGVGALPDADLYCDSNANTLLSVSKSSKFRIPNLSKLGMLNIDGLDKLKDLEKPIGSFGRAMEKSKGKDTTTGHWEIAGLISSTPFPTYPKGFPDEIINEFTKQTGRNILCNKPYSGTNVIDDYGVKHMQTGDLIVYTSADSVFQIAAHEDIVKVDLLYKYCEIARNILVGKNAVARVIARPFIGTAGDFTRTARRRDFSLVPPSTTMLDLLNEQGLKVMGIGKIEDIFAGKGLNEVMHTVSNNDGMKKALECLSFCESGLYFTNLVDFDMLFGHRNDIDGYAAALSEFDLWLGTFMEKMDKNDILIITADHGCDPSTPSTDHSREYIPVLIYGEKIKKGVNIKTLSSFADIGATICDILKVKYTLSGESFYNQIKKIEIFS